jgi:aminoglycoside phosphotransferase (APT) family kinase protein
VRVSDVLREALPDAEERDVHLVESGWDSRVVDVGGEWIIRIARRHAVADRYRVETALLLELAPSLPLPVPEPVRTGACWILTRRLSGSAFDGDADIRPLGAFLTALHSFPTDRARALGAEFHDPQRDADRFRGLVLPLLAPAERRAGEALLDEHSATHFEPRLTHADLGPEHVLVHEGGISGVIDWTDVRLGDPAIDLAWALQAEPEIASTYAADASLARRALIYHALGPWHEVELGIERGDSRWIESGLAGVRARLLKVTEGAGTMGE